MPALITLLLLKSQVGSLIPERPQVTGLTQCILWAFPE